MNLQRGGFSRLIRFSELPDWLHGLCQLGAGCAVSVWYTSAGQQRWISAGGQANHGLSTSWHVELAIMRTQAKGLFAQRVFGTRLIAVGVKLSFWFLMPYDLCGVYLLSMSLCHTLSCVRLILGSCWVNLMCRSLNLQWTVGRSSRFPDRMGPHSGAGAAEAGLFRIRLG